MLSITTPVAPVHWGQPLPWRACQLCDHGDDAAGERVCTCPAVARPHAHLPVDLARRQGGPCGPEAHHLRFAGLLG